MGGIVGSAPTVTVEHAGTWCESCGRLPALVTVRWPDACFRVCPGCALACLDPPVIDNLEPAAAELPAPRREDGPMPTVYQVRDTAGRWYRTAAAGPVVACQQVANRYGVTVVAWRFSRDPYDAINVGFGEITE